MCLGRGGGVHAFSILLRCSESHFPSLCPKGLQVNTCSMLDECGAASLHQQELALALCELCGSLLLKCYFTNDCCAMHCKQAVHCVTVLPCTACACRYYGEAMPFPVPASGFLPTPQYQWLTVQQVVEDTAAVLAHVRDSMHMPAAVPAVVIGGSYGERCTAAYLHCSLLYLAAL